MLSNATTIDSDLNYIRSKQQQTQYKKKKEEEKKKKENEKLV
ncbi:MAG TPA: hypothetical protein VJ729_01735 [Nitrososphaeraceae archaeon]|nr:hypothetical protein [Nitrososphaeraceae archaeon]